MNVRIALFSISIVILLTGCMGNDGSDGQVYLSIHLYDGWYTYRDNNPGIPDNLVNGKDYVCQAGYYEFEYYYFKNGNLIKIWGYYQLYQDKGQKGKLFWQDGNDGSDRHYKLYCRSDGASFEVTSIQQEDYLNFNMSISKSKS